MRENDRDFRIHDYIELNEFDSEKDAPEREKYSGRCALYQITYILDSPEYCKDGYVVLGLTKIIRPRQFVSGNREDEII